MNTHGRGGDIVFRLTSAIRAFTRSRSLAERFRFARAAPAGLRSGGAGDATHVGRRGHAWSSRNVLCFRDGLEGGK
jgi:hypothetical protein